MFTELGGQHEVFVLYFYPFTYAMQATAAFGALLICPLSFELEYGSDCFWPVSVSPDERCC